jgi:hypothetical protein
MAETAESKKKEAKPFSLIESFGNMGKGIGKFLDKEPVKFGALLGIFGSAALNWSTLMPILVGLPVVGPVAAAVIAGVTSFGGWAATAVQEGVKNFAIPGITPAVPDLG